MGVCRQAAGAISTTVNLRAASQSDLKYCCAAAANAASPNTTVALREAKFVWMSASRPSANRNGWVTSAPTVGPEGEGRRRPCAPPARRASLGCPCRSPSRAGRQGAFPTCRGTSRSGPCRRPRPRSRGTGRTGWPRHSTRAHRLRLTRSACHGCSRLGACPWQGSDGMRPPPFHGTRSDRGAWSSNESFRGAVSSNTGGGMAGHPLRTASEVRMRRRSPSAACGRTFPLRAS